MRILFWQTPFWPGVGGMEQHAAELLPVVAARGHHIEVVAELTDRCGAEHDSFAGIPVHRFPFLRALAGRDLATMRTLRDGVAAVKRALRPDVVHLNFSDPAALFHLQTRHVHPAPTVTTLHQTLPGVSGDGLLRTLLLDSAWVTGCASAVIADARRIAPAVAERSSVLPYGIVPPAPGCTPPPAGPPHLVALGRLVREKGFDLALDAFATLRAEWPLLRLTLAGDGPARAELEARAPDGVRFFGAASRAEVGRLLSEATLVLVPSRERYEGLPLVTLEAAHMARPVVAARVGGMAEAVEDRVTGLLVPPDDAAALAAAVAALLRDGTRASRMGAAARLRARERFGVARHADELEALYHRVVGA